jgi:hypothetical protein
VTTIGELGTLPVTGNQCMLQRNTKFKSLSISLQRALVASYG